ncbi:CAP domain-containing protein, partial [Streptomyces mirabilis]|uniref:CAP domain-containing protein n=1 Tax=Streptomyces mirabilis TaxID=68239 RepID=UPI0033B03209
MKPKSLATAAAMICGLIMMGPTPVAFAQVRAAPAPVLDEKSPTCPSSTAPPGTGSQISAADAADIVRAHNAARQEAVQKYNPGLSVVSVTWNPKLACDAQAWADDPASSQGGARHHSSPATNGNEGENLFNAFPGPARPLMALDPSVSFSWIAEKSKFDADNNAPVNKPGTNSAAWSHYSQMVWMSPTSSTTSIGCGVKQGVPVSSSTGWILVCRYLAAGNIDGQQAIPGGGGPVPPPKLSSLSGGQVAMAQQSDNLLTALAVDKNGYLNVAWAGDGKPWHDPV